MIIHHDEHEHTTPVRYNRAARMLNCWLKDLNYQDAAGSPLVLPIEGETKSFTSLVRANAGNIPVIAVLNELVRLGTVLHQ